MCIYVLDAAGKKSYAQAEKYLHQMMHSLFWRSEHCYRQGLSSSMSCCVPVWWQHNQIYHSESRV